MESRVLSGATTVSTGIPRLSKPARLSPTCFAAVRLAGAVDGSGGNLIWGRQLRPAILLESSSPLASSVPVTKREILRPSLAASSSPAEGSDSSGYFLNVIFNILNKKIYNYFPYPFFVSVIHLGVGVVYCLVSWAVGLPKRAPMDSNQLKLLIPVAVCHAIGHVTSNVSFAAVAVSFTHTIKGVSMASLTELSFNWLGFISAMISNISFTYRSIYSKKAMTDMDSTNLYAYISIIALFVCIPPAIIFEGPQLLKSGFSDAIAKVGLTKFITDLFWVGLFYHLYNQLATNTLERVAPLTHAVGNVLKRVFVIGFSIIFFGNRISTQTGIGTCVAIAGVAIYSFIKAKMEEEKRVRPSKKHIRKYEPMNL
ncbi:hypothetical protein RHGRI_004701 [Rhododendron griersonianum]|uniref:Sugar phosphate transporter domain-containing protein n=1 Tax=Rhododendron griersonianum TaxID=479676 RepID=A0AAV6LBP7_9ERIC|nr:hypothetical protein RHGRI_004701 [Rhododendron griersonianum]